MFGKIATDRCNQRPIPNKDRTKRYLLYRPIKRAKQTEGRPCVDWAAVGSLSSYINRHSTIIPIDTWLSKEHAKERMDGGLAREKYATAQIVQHKINTCSWINVNFDPQPFGQERVSENWVIMMLGLWMQRMDAYLMFVSVYRVPLPIQ